MGILLGVKKMVAVTLAAASDITSELGRHCPSPLTVLVLLYIRKNVLGGSILPK